MFFVTHYTALNFNPLLGEVCTLFVIQCFLASLPYPLDYACCFFKIFMNGTTNAAFWPSHRILGLLVISRAKFKYSSYEQNRILNILGVLRIFIFVFRI